MKVCLQEPVTAPGISLQNEQCTAPEIPLQQRRGQLNIFEDKNINCPHPKYHEKLVVDLAALQMSVLQDAFTKARKESGLRDRASLLVHIAKAFLEGCPTSGKRRKPCYQIVIHRHLPSGLAWCDTLKGERPVSPEILEKALCDVETVQLDEPESPSTRDRNDEKATDSCVIKEDAGSINSDIQKERNLNWQGGFACQGRTLSYINEVVSPY